MSLNEPSSNGVSAAAVSSDSEEVQSTAHASRWRLIVREVRSVTETGPAAGSSPGDKGRVCS